MTAAQEYRQQRLERIRDNKILRDTSNRAPVFAQRCEQHGQLVSFDGDHTMLGDGCSGCATEVAKALRWMRKHPYVMEAVDA